MDLVFEVLEGGPELARGQILPVLHVLYTLFGKLPVETVTPLGLLALVERGLFIGGPACGIHFLRSRPAVVGGGRRAFAAFSETLVVSKLRVVPGIRHDLAFLRVPNLVGHAVQKKPVVAYDDERAVIAVERIHEDAA